MMHIPLFIARTVRDSVLAVPGVAGLTAGRHGGTVTYGPDEAVPGVAVHTYASGYGVEIRLVATASLSTDLRELGDRVRVAALRSMERQSVDTVHGVGVVIDDFISEVRD